MKLKRLIASLLLAASVLALTVPAFGASSFSDVHDETTAVNVDILRLMGVVKGAGDNSYLPDETLTRAAFCAMAIRTMGREAETERYKNRTIFSDVTARHWGRGYVNLAASISVGDGGTRLIAGVGDGRFLPDEPISYAEAATILCRMLGYGDDKAGGVWPDGYVNLARSIGLDEGLSVSAPLRPMTRAQAARLFVNLLGSKSADGQKFYTALGSVTEHVLLLAVDGSAGTIRTSRGTYATAVGGMAPTVLMGRCGTLVLNDRSEIVTFIPDGGTSAVITLAQDGEAVWLRGTDGVRYTLSPDTPVFRADRDEASTYADLWKDLRADDEVTLYLEDEKVTGVYFAGRTAGSTEAFVVKGKVIADNLRHLTGGAEGYTIIKNGDPVSLSQLKDYDVITYDPITNTLTVSDLRLNCVYEFAQPSPVTPETITVLGHTFEVLSSALDSIGQHKLGQSVSLLLTADGKVAGMVDPVGSNMLAFSGSDRVTVLLPAGGTIELKGAVREKVQNRLVTAYGSKGDVLDVMAAPVYVAPGDFDTSAMTLGDYRVSAAVRLYESADGGNLAPIGMSQLEERVVPQSKILSCHRNKDGVVDVIVVKTVTGDHYSYGRLSKDLVEFYVGELSGSNGAVVVTNSGGKQSPIITTRRFEEGCFGGAVAGVRTIEGVPVAADVVTLAEIGGVRRSDFFCQNGVWYVYAGGASYEVAREVEGYIRANGAWFTQPAGQRLDAIRTFSNDMTVCVDPIGQKVRVIVAN